MSSRIDEILEVLQEVRSKYVKEGFIPSISDIRQTAVETVARKRGVAKSTVADKFVRQLRPHVEDTDAFDRLLETYFRNSSTALRDVLLSHAVGSEDVEHINAAFGSSQLSMETKEDIKDFSVPEKPIVPQNLHKASYSLRTISNTRTDKKLIEQSQILARIVQALSPLYTDTTLQPSQRQLMETTVGAAIWYLPQGMEFWKGKISIAAVKAFHPTNSPTPKLTKEHEYPRKVAARELLSIEWGTIQDPSMEVLRRYKQRYGIFNYVLKDENRRLMQYQKAGDFDNPVRAYQMAGIKLVVITREELKKLQQRDESTIEKIIAKAD